jgi:ribosome-binding protein aMBF1 (putative translation factor)
MLNCDSRALLSNPGSQLPMFMAPPNDMRFSHIGQDLHIKSAVKKTIRLNQQKKLLVLLRGVRVEAGLTQSELASRLGTDQTFISKYESGERRLDILELREVCQVIGIDFVAFIRRLEKDLKSD